MTSSSRGCGKVGIQRLLRDFQARWESRVLDFSTSRLFHSPSALRFVVCQGRTLGAVSAQPVRSMGEAVASVRVLLAGHGAARQPASQATRFNLQPAILNADRVVPIHGPLTL